jgi:hypothetical protein
VCSLYAEYRQCQASDRFGNSGISATPSSHRDGLRSQDACAGFPYACTRRTCNQFGRTCVYSGSGRPRAAFDRDVVAMDTSVFPVGPRQRPVARAV